MEDKKYIVQADFNLYSKFEIFSDEEAFFKWVFRDVDSKDCSPYAFIYEIHALLESESPSETKESVRGLRAAGRDYMPRLIDECHKRGIKMIFNHRISEVDGETGAKNRDSRNPIKQEHPDWVVKTWWPQGHWNIAAEGVRKMKLEYLERMLKKYDFDGVNIDFSRHTPCYPVGREWELRRFGTEFMSSVRALGNSLGRDFLVGAKVPKCEEYCRADGFDVQEWARLGLVDYFEVGSRSINVDIEWYKRITEGTDIEIYPCWDRHHCTDAYHDYPPYFHRGLIANWLGQGADGVVCFNYYPTRDEIEPISRYTQHSSPSSINDLYVSMLESDDTSLLRMYSTDRRGGYPFRSGKFTSNENCQLPLAVPNDDTPAEVIVEAYGRNEGKATISLTLSAAKPEDKFRLWLNGEELEITRADFEHEDPQIFWPAPQPTSIGRASEYNCKCPSKLLLLEAEVCASRLIRGKNRIEVGNVDRYDYFCDNISVEKAEIYIGEK